MNGLLNDLRALRDRWRGCDVKHGGDYLAGHEYGKHNCADELDALIEKHEPCPDAVRDGVQMLKIRFLRWRDPPVELPAESVIEEVVRALIEKHGG